jgi:uncharacterized protein (TIGR04255 family)
MTLKFKEYEDVPLGNPPAREVICQVRFAPLLEITQNLPTQFQREIRTKFPKFAVTQNIGLGGGQALPSEYAFNSSDNLSTASLGADFIAYATREYRHWKSFVSEVKFLLEAFTTSYGIILSTRIGLRYVNEITLDSTNTESIEDLLSILNEDLRCLLINPAWGLPRKAVFQLSIPDSNNEFALRLGLGQEPSTRVILDFDYFCGFEPPTEMQIDSILEYLDLFHKKNYLAFRWAIAEDHIDVFEPMVA